MSLPADHSQIPHRGMITVAIMLATIMQALDTTIANVALPHMQGALQSSQDQITWVLTSYIVAAATMYEVSTQVIWSWELWSAPCMCGSATLAIVVSSACMIVASMMDTVIIPRCGMRE